jgi:hypothetical protein
LSPFIVSGSVDVYVGDSFALEKGRDAISRAISLHRPRRLQENDGRIVFSGGLLRLVSSLNLLGPVTDGEVALLMQGPNLRITYTITLYELVALVLVFSTGLGLAVAQTGGPWWGVGALAAAWLFGMNVVVLKVRFRRLLRRAVLSEVGPHSA